MRKFNFVVIFCLTILILLVHQRTMAQDFAYVPPPVFQSNENDRKELKEVLTSLEKKFGIYFTFESQVVRNKVFKNEVKITEDLEQTLKNVLNPFNLQFRKLSDKFYTIYPAEESVPKEKKPKTNDDFQSMDSERMKSFFSTFVAPTLPPLQLAVSGVVTDENNITLPGASVLEKGTTNGTSSDADGRYSLNILNADAVLVISFIGYTTQEVSVNGRSLINVALTPSVLSLEEVVVVGYGTQRKRDLTGSVASVGAEELEERPNISVMQSLQGSIAGMNVGQVNVAGEEPSLSIRGRTSISGDQNPLIVLDGVIFRGSIIDINPNDIKTIDVLKDASSTAVYGSRAANGVIIITTKTGKARGLTVNYSAFYSILEPTKEFRPESPAQHIERIAAAYFLESRTEASGYLEPKPGYDITSTFRTSDHLRAYNEGIVTDWYDLTTNSNLNVMNHNLSIVNRNDQGGYFVSAGYADQDGYMVNEDYKRFNARINIDNNITDWLELGVQTFLTSSDYSGQDIGTNSRYIFHAYAPAYAADGVSLLQNPRGVGTGTFSPLLLMESDDLDKRLNLFGNVYADVKIPFVEGLSIRSNFNVNSIRNSEYFYRHYVNDFQGQGRKYEGVGNDWANDNILTYSRKFNRHRVNATVAYGREKRRFNSTAATAFNFISDQLGYNRLQAGSAELQSVESAAWQETSLYQLNRLFYGYDDRYLVTLTVRTDGFSGFGEDYKYGTFPSASAAWVLSEENFIRNSLGFFDHLKLRGSYGANGNRTIERYDTWSRVAGGFTYIAGDEIPVYTQGNASLANRDLKWEATIGLNVGLDFSIIKTRVSGSIDYYNTNTQDLLYDVDIPGIMRFESIADNLGELHNEGLEITLSSRNIVRENFEWSTQVNFSRNRNELRELLGFDSDGDGEEDDLISEGLFIGESLSAIYDYETNGELWQVGEEIPNTADMGSYKITDTDGSGVIDPNDRTILGNTMPAFRWSMNNRFKYKNWNLSIFINSIQGNDHYYLGRDALVGSAFNNLNNTLFDVTAFPHGLDFWLPENPDARYQRLGVSISSGINASRYIPRSFIRLQDVSLSYAFDEGTLETIGNINGLRLFVTGKNLYTWTKWPGWDPETGERITSTGRPVMRHYTFGIDVKF